MDSTRELAIYEVYSRGEDTMRTVKLYGAGLIGRIDVRYVPATYIDPETNEPVQTTVRRDERFYYINDHLGSVRAIVDSSGTTVFAQDTYPYGDVYRNYSLGGYSDQKYDFTGKERDVETGLHYYGARYYDSDSGRWLQVDPLADKYPGWSPYNYCVNNPLRFVDPDGRKIKFAKNCSAEFKADYYKTVTHLKSKNALGALGELINRKETITLVESKGGEKSIDYANNKIINWNTKLGLVTTSGNVLSPATILVHEASHSLRAIKDPQGYIKDTEQKNSNYTNSEEKRVIQGDEQQTAEKLGEVSPGASTREDHYGAFIQVISPTSNVTIYDQPEDKDVKKEKK